MSARRCDYERDSWIDEFWSSKILDFGCSDALKFRNSDALKILNCSQLYKLTGYVMFLHFCRGSSISHSFSLSLSLKTF